MIVGTAGHIDHGKTSLVRALTGIDADRLPEEKKRGITIELGYAYLPLEEGGMIGFVDMPGHEKLVRTMVAGASGIDFALLLVAADDGVMPQTIEHLTVLSLLGIQRGAAVLTKIDRVDDKVRAQRVTEVQNLLAEHDFAAFPVLQVSSVSGDGVAALRALLLNEAGEKSQQLSQAEGFRMGLDRAFTLDGVGTVVAGSIAAGQVAVGDALCLAHAPDRTFRVRSLQVHGHSVERAERGQRCAVGLAGLERNEVERGQMLCDPAIAQQTDRFDVLLKVAKTEEGPLRSGTKVHVHVATQDCLASIAILGAPSLAPGESGMAQVVLQRSLAVWQGDRFILRDASASRTIGGGHILDTHAPARYRQTPQRLAYLESQTQSDVVQRMMQTLAHAPFGMHGGEWLRANGLREWPFEPEQLKNVVVAKERSWLIAHTRQVENAMLVTQALTAFHQRYPDDIGPDRQRMRRLALPRMPELLWRELLKHLLESHAIAERNGFVHLPEHGVLLAEAEKIVGQRALPLLRDGRFDPPWVRDIAGTTNLPEAQVRTVLARMAKGGDVYQIVKDLYYHPDVVYELAGLVRTITIKDGKITAASYRDSTGLGRKRAIQILEFFDRIGFLRRVDDVHLLRIGTDLFPERES